jgi:sigma-54 dependent transcriptional regulator, acetoin dehydrogenase operon transcriptional activator AcoR
MASRTKSRPPPRPLSTTARTAETSESASGDEDGLGPRPALVLVLECQRPLCAGARYDLEGTHELRIGRGSARELVTKGDASELALPDSRLSSRHARVLRRSKGWTIVDEGSRNGTHKNGVAVSEAPLGDGDRLQLGHSFFFFRDRPAPRARVYDGSAVHAGLRTLDPVLAERLSKLGRIAPTPIPVLVLGETGTGKELVARALHELSLRSGPFVAVNCAAIPATLVESQLFGHVRGAFSGAVRDELGLVRAAHGGTLFLDEIGDLAPAAQATLLRVLQSGELLPVGATRPVGVDVRIIAATHQPLDALRERGVFRSDLYARLAGFVFELPPLRERLDDVGLLLASFAAAHGGRVRADLRLRPEVGAALLAHGWPLNVRELEQAFLAAAALAENGVVRSEDLPASISAARWGSTVPPPTARDSLPPSDREVYDALRAALVDAGGNVTDAARRMGKARQQIQRWMRRFGLRSDEFAR